MVVSFTFSGSYSRDPTSFRTCQNMMMTIFTSFLRHLNANTWPPTLCILPSLGGQGTLHQAHLMTFLNAKVMFLGPGRHTEGRMHKVNPIQHSYLQKSLNPLLSMMSRDLGPLHFHFTRASIWSKFALVNPVMVRTQPASGASAENADSPIHTSVSRSVWSNVTFPLPSSGTAKILSHKYSPDFGWYQRTVSVAVYRSRIFPLGVGDHPGFLPHPLYGRPPAQKPHSTLNSQLPALVFGDLSPAASREVPSPQSQTRCTVHPVSPLRHMHVPMFGLVLLTPPLHNSMQLKQNILSHSRGIPHLLKIELWQKLPFL